MMAPFHCGPGMVRQYDVGLDDAQLLSVEGLSDDVAQICVRDSSGSKVQPPPGLQLRTATGKWGFEAVGQQYASWQHDFSIVLDDQERLRTSPHMQMVEIFPPLPRRRWA